MIGKWVVVAVDPREEGREARSSDFPREIAPFLARDWLRQRHDVLRIDGPNGVVIDKHQIASWLAANPG